MNNHISSISLDESIFVEPKDIRFHIREFYNALYSQKVGVWFDISGLNFEQISEVQADSLIKPFEESEIFSAGSSSRKKKAPVPKFAGSSNIKDYRPISLINGLYKMLSKALSRKLSPLISHVVFNSHHAFLKERSILECSMIANELVHLANRMKDKHHVLKLDFHKVFDSIAWDFLFSVMRCMNFLEKWIKWMLCYLSSATTALLVNGSPIDPIFLRRCVPQGDSISPYLFVIAVEGLKRISDRSAEMGFNEGLPLSNREAYL
ncbi:uncharacterized protein LOC126661821 [Mercurialis annua]|uniref:uncharacterized protein LOC126661821 n=1 Tax=Mercurialis annua TaxID=3986 RepID=UPI00215F4801|nr:uncharacterized protein LOC126661821 [Mercurialis annua]